MDLIKMGAELLSEKLGLNVDLDSISGALSQLLGDGKGNLDLAGLAGRMAESGGLESVLGTWLGDGANAPVSAQSIFDLLGKSKVADFASSVGTEPETAAEGLSDVLPQLMDKASSGGSLLDAAGGIGGLMSAATSFFNK
ncbi:hypothetical protein H2508_05050 [Parahaliea sp. F7430]|uniref:DUF937 domain-containing protein n=1 Tax=Sediminihaliea albiluteola TaxID=2758564 RepID=A0A7W2TV26_9GAMM|nr:YidB family protein [Sediminihaliea albiluteola]MBA6412472.1 hypothetical protein [Sediminihaliea albiluteola]